MMATKQYNGMAGITANVPFSLIHVGLFDIMVKKDELFIKPSKPI